MNKRKYYGRKIKKTKNLYRRKKSAGQKIFGTVVLVFAVAAIAFLGFCIGKPLLDYIGSIGTKEIPEWTPADSYARQNPEPAVTTTTAGTTAPSEPGEFQTTAGGADSAAEPVMSEPEILLVSTEVPSGALANRSSLSAVLAKAKSAGFNSAVVQLKDRSGHLRYKSGVPGTDGLITGSMTLDEIMSAFQENGIVPIAEIAVLSDPEGCARFTDMNYKIMDTDTSWLDYSTGVPTRWANPENSATREYISAISEEITAAGFENILATDVIFPNFQPYDREFIPARYFAFERYNLLYNVVKPGYMIEMKASDILAAEAFGRTAEVLCDISKLDGNTVSPIISRKDLSAESGGYPAEAKSFVETVLSLVKKKTGSLPIVPIIDSSGFDDAEIAKISGALGELGYDSYIIR